MKRLLKWLFNGVGFRAWLKDWRRGYDDSDAISAQAKLDAFRGSPGEIIEMTNREMAAVIGAFKRQGLM